MSAGVAQAARAAVARLLDGIEHAAADELPGDVVAERVDGGIRLSGPRLALRWMTDARLRGLALLAARRKA